MSAGNYFETERKAYDLRTKAITTSSTLTTYTAKVGGASDNFVVDRFIRVTSSSGNSLTVMLPDGKYYGQRFTILFEVEANAETVDVTTTTGDNATQMTAAGGYSGLMWHGGTLGWAEVLTSAT